MSKDRVTKHRKGILRAIELEAERARTLLAGGNRAEARNALRRKKYWEVNLGKSDAMLFKLEEVLAGIQMAQVNKIAFEGLEAGTTVLKEMQRDLSLDRVETLMSDRADALAVLDEAQRTMGVAEDEDVLKQLEELEAATLADQLPAVPVPGELRLSSPAMASESSGQVTAARELVEEAAVDEGMSQGAMLAAA